LTPAFALQRGSTRAGLPPEGGHFTQSKRHTGNNFVRSFVDFAHRINASGSARVHSTRDVSA
jgi:hypothetical protein